MPDSTHRSDSDVINRKTPDCERLSERCNVRVGTLEHAKGSEGIALLPLCFLLDAVEAVGIVLLIAIGALILEQADFVVEPLGDLAPAELKLPLPVRELDVL